MDNKARIVTIIGDKEAINNFDKVIAVFAGNYAGTCFLEINKPLPEEIFKKGGESK